MILVDANLLIYAWNTDAPEHEAARDWLEGRLNGVEGVGLPWASLLAFARIVSNPRIFDHPATPDEAWDAVEAWLGLRSTFVPEPTERHPGILATLIPAVDRPNLLPDAHLAALAIEYGLALQTTDRDFARFPSLRWENPISE